MVKKPILAISDKALRERIEKTFPIITPTTPIPKWDGHW